MKRTSLKRNSLDAKASDVPVGELLREQRRTSLEHLQKRACGRSSARLRRLQRAARKIMMVRAFRARLEEAVGERTMAEVEAMLEGRGAGGGGGGSDGGGGGGSATDVLARLVEDGRVAGAMQRALSATLGGSADDAAALLQILADAATDGGDAQLGEEVRAPPSNTRSALARSHARQPVHASLPPSIHRYTGTKALTRASNRRRCRERRGRRRRRRGGRRRR